MPNDWSSKPHAIALYIAPDAATAEAVAAGVAGAWATVIGNRGWVTVIRPPAQLPDTYQGLRLRSLYGLDAATLPEVLEVVKGDAELALSVGYRLGQLSG